MRLAAIVGICVLSFCALGNTAPVAARDILQATQSEDNPPGNSTPQSSPTQSPTDQEKTADRSPGSSQTAPAPCPENSQSTSTAKADCKPATKTRTHRKTIAPAQTNKNPGPTKTVVRNGGTDDSNLNLSPGVSPQQASREANSTNKLLATSDANLKKISGRQLNASQQDTVKQIESYMDQAKKATNDGDLQRAYNLAVKANLLSAELAGH
jgi:hypothetical protein